MRATALGALDRMGRLDTRDLEHALADPDPVVRRRAAQISAAHPSIPVMGRLVELLAGDGTVAEMAAWALGECSGGPAAAVERGDGTGEVAVESSGGPDQDAVVDALAAMAVDHRDPLCREAAVAALGAIGDPGGLPAILAATRDKPAVRRRAVLALAPFDGPDVDEALERALHDRDWQVRQAAEDLRS